VTVDPSAALRLRFQDARKDPTLAVLEGFHALKHALRFGAEILEACTRSAGDLRRLASALAPDLEDRLDGLVGTVDSHTFETLAPRPPSTGVMALARRPELDPGALLGRADAAPLVLLERPTHHGNIGAVVRVAAAAAASGVLVTGPHDPWHPAALRGGAGLQYALPVGSLGPDSMDRVVASERIVIAVDPEGEPLNRGHDLGGSVLVFGSERTGVSKGLLTRADRSIAIPMRPGVSSLNLATAVATVLYLGGAPFLR
jgi:TrmH family RNA methyltransferase